MPRASAASPAGRAIVAAVLVLGALLLVLPVAAAAVSSPERLPAVLALAIVEAVLLAAGGHPLSLYPDEIVRPATRVRWQQALWLALLCVPWAGLIALAPDATYFGFALFFLMLWLLPPLAGALAALGLAALAAAGQGFHHGWSTGAVLGPLAAAAVIIAVMMGFRSLLAETTERAELIAELERTQAKLAETERRAGIVDERARLARELHDTVAQHLSSIQLLLQAAESADGDERGSRIGQAREAAGAALAETRRVISDLSPAPLADGTLPVALERLAAQATARGRLRASFRVSGEPRRLPMPVEATLLRIAQEAVANAERHAGAAACELVLAIEPDAVTLEIADDGRGFDPEPVLAAAPGAEHGFGLQGLRARAAELGGNAAVVAAPGEGTLVSVRLPLEPVRETA